VDEGNELLDQWTPDPWEAERKARRWRWAAAGFAFATVAVPFCGGLLWGFSAPVLLGFSMPLFIFLAHYCWSQAW
jgi:hypothetical protein